VRQSDAEIFGVDTSSGKPVGELALGQAHPNISFDDYKLIPYVNNSKLGLMARSPAHFLQAWQEPSESASEPFRFGRLVHAYILEPETFGDHYKTMPDFEVGIDSKRPKLTKEYKQLVSQWNEQNAGREAILPADWTRLQDIRGVLHLKPRAQEYLRGGSRELTVCWQDQETGIKCKARLDSYQPEKRRIVDLKTSRDAAEFGKSIARFGYDRQAAFYKMGAEAVGLPVDEFCFVVVESDPIHGCISAPLDRFTLRDGELQVRQLLRRLAECKRTGEFPTYLDPETFKKPHWSFVFPEELTAHGRTAAAHSAA